MTALDAVKALAHIKYPEVAVLAVAVDRNAPYTVMLPAIVKDAALAELVQVAVDVEATVYAGLLVAGES